MDEMSVTIARLKGIYLAYAYNNKTHCIIDFSIGGRTKEVMGRVTKTVLGLSPTRVYTDGLNLDPGLIGRAIHKSDKFLPCILNE